MEPLRPLFWGQGMFLQPHHFQQQDRYHEARLHRALHWLLPFGWGIKALAINEAALRDFRFEIERCEMRLADGTLLRFQGEQLPNNMRIRPRALERAFEASGRPLGVYLGVQRLRQEGKNLTSLTVQNAGSPETAAPGPGRFSVEETQEADLCGEEGSHATLQYLVYEARLFFDTDPVIQQAEHEYELLKIADVVREGQRLGLSTHYIPPVLSIKASALLTSMLGALRDELTAKGHELMDYRRQLRVHTIDMGSRDTVFLLMRQAVNRYIPLWHHHLEVEDTHPSVLYALLRQMIGEFSTFSETISVLGGSATESAAPPALSYRHDHLWECFDAALHIVRDLLSELAKGPDYVIPLIFDGTCYTAPLDKRSLEGHNHYYLVIKVDMPPREVERLLTETGKVCARQDLEELRRRALSGVGAKYLEVPPEELPRRAHWAYFELAHRGPLWERIQQHENMAVYCQLPPETVEMQLSVLRDT